MIIIGLGSNLSSHIGTPLETCEEALKEIEKRGIRVVKLSKWWKTEPVPVSDQPWFVNGVAQIETDLEPLSLLDILHEIENLFGRKRIHVNDARTLDLDLLVYNDVIMDTPIHIPHRRMSRRAFVLFPLKEVAPEWKDPRTGHNINHFISELPTQQKLEHEKNS